PQPNTGTAIAARRGPATPVVAGATVAVGQKPWSSTPWSTSVAVASRCVWGLLGGVDGGLDRRVDAFGCGVGCHLADHVADLADLAADQQPDALAFQALGEFGE